VSAAVEGPAVAVACFLHTVKKTVISTEAAHSLIVSRAVEKSAFSLSITRIHSTDVLHHDAHNVPICHDFVNRKTGKNTRILVVPNVIYCVIHNKRINFGFNPLKNLAALREP
jgi:hypothetical protein